MQVKPSTIAVCLLIWFGICVIGTGMAFDAMARQEIERQNQREGF